MREQCLGNQGEESRRGEGPAEVTMLQREPLSIDKGSPNLFGHWLVTGDHGWCSQATVGLRSKGAVGSQT